jgi:AbiEi antitoxin C-terminal domain
LVARRLSGTLAAVVEELELDQPTVVTMSELRDIAMRAGLRTAPNVIAARLREQGWLLPTDRRGVWEFAPGAHAGPVGHQDPLMPLRAALAGGSNVAAALALGSAAWALGSADRVPARLDVAVPVGCRVSSSLNRATAVTTFTSHIGYTTAKGVPCHRPETVLVHLAATPSVPRSWASALEWLPAMAAEADPARFAAEVEQRPRAVAVRAGYLLSGLRPDLADPLRPLAGDLFRFGSRSGEPLRHDRSWRVVDYLLPSHPATWVIDE